MTNNYSERNLTVSSHNGHTPEKSYNIQIARAKLQKCRYYLSMACVHFYMCADDTQLHIDFSPEDEVFAHVVIAECVKEIKAWTSENFLLLNLVWHLYLPRP